MVEFEAKTALLRKRVAALSFPDEVMDEASSAVLAAGMRLPDAARTLRKEWLNDMVASTDSAEFRHASRDPGAHFLAWIKERSKNRYHVTWRSVDAVAMRLGADIASRLAMVVWPQEIAWAQRLRLSDNPVIATKAAMFLREAEGNPAKLFGKIADLHSDALVRSGYSDNPAQETSPSEIRFADCLPEFNPLFLRYAARSYGEVLLSMPRERIELLAGRASRDERQERLELAAAASARTTRRFPMRRILSIISAAHSMGISPNDLFLLETRFLALLESGKVEADSGTRSPQAAFVTMIASPLSRETLLSEAQAPDGEPSEILWGVANLDRRWLGTLPESYGKWSQKWYRHLENWQADVVDERRAAPFDPVSDFGFFLVESEQS